ncbi:hypothetical protein J6590_031405 [Homalodisca vitripennis]|nr:hypothetical protein J6590_031405 [Homalodisca vitripennis]
MYVRGREREMRLTETYRVEKVMKGGVRVKGLERGRGKVRGDKRTKKDGGSRRGEERGLFQDNTESCWVPDKHEQELSFVLKHCCPRE